MDTRKTDPISLILTAMLEGIHRVLFNTLHVICSTIRLKFMHFKPCASTGARNMTNNPQMYGEKSQRQFSSETDESFSRTPCTITSLQHAQTGDKKRPANFVANGFNACGRLCGYPGHVPTSSAVLGTVHEQRGAGMATRFLYLPHNGSNLNKRGIVAFAGDHTEVSTTTSTTA